MNPIQCNRFETDPPSCRFYVFFPNGKRKKVHVEGEPDFNSVAEDFKKLGVTVESASLKAAYDAPGTKIGVRMTAGEAPIGYLDTCIVSGIAKGDLEQEELVAVESLIDLHNQGSINIVTSSVVSEEHAEIPDEPRVQHQIIYKLLRKLPTVQAVSVSKSLPTTGAGGGVKKDRLLISLEAVLRGKDAEHVFQAIKNGATYFVTVDKKTILSHADEIENAWGLKAMKPSDVVADLEQREPLCHGQAR